MTATIGTTLNQRWAAKTCLYLHLAAGRPATIAIAITIRDHDHDGR